MVPYAEQNMLQPSNKTNVSVIRLLLFLLLCWRPNTTNQILLSYLFNTNPCLWTWVPLILSLKISSSKENINYGKQTMSYKKTSATGSQATCDILYRDMLDTETQVYS
jgi:hypothetical protein